MPVRTTCDPPEPGSVRCGHRHALYRITDQWGCDNHGVHYVYACPMRLGGDVCGDVVTVPQPDGNCEDGDDEDEDDADS